MKDLYVISGATGMTGNELVHQLLGAGQKVIGFDNFFASSIDTVKDVLNNPDFIFHEYDLNAGSDMEALKNEVVLLKNKHSKIIYINCAAVVHTEHFYEVEHTYTTNVVSMKSFLEQAIEVGANVYVNCSTSEVYSMHSWDEAKGGGRCGKRLFTAFDRRTQSADELCCRKAPYRVFHKRCRRQRTHQGVQHSLCQCIQQA